MFSRNIVRKIDGKLSEKTSQNTPTHLPEASHEYPEIANKPVRMKTNEDASKTDEKPRRIKDN